MKPKIEVNTSKSNDLFSQAVSQKLQDERLIPEQSAEIEEEEDDDSLEDFDILLGEEEEEEQQVPAAAPLDPNVQAITANMSKLVEALTPKPTAPAVKPRTAIQPVNIAELKEKFNKDFHETDDPFNLVQDFAQKLLNPALAQQNLNLQNVNKELLKQQPKYKLVFEHYEVEMENVIASLPPEQQTHPDAYKYAADQMLITHFDEITKLQSEQVQPTIPTAVTTRPGKTKTAQATSAIATPSTSQRKVVRATAYEEKLAKTYGISVKDAVIMNRRNKR